ncbi:MAG: glycosyltransferase [Gammaproteobacteria bacterium]|jgi:glycosyltransferase involved in cell wall biosynthesis|nr:glycosyltransferase [Gammaproteobacteria bacterium]
MSSLNQNPEKRPLVSVVVPVYNGEPYIASALESVFAQSLTDWELIVVDDCSGDNTWQTIQGFASDERVRCFRNTRNLGQFPTHNLGAEPARGRYLKFLHADDLLYPHCLEIMAAQMEAYPEAGMGISSENGPWHSPNPLLPIQLWSNYLLRKSSLLSKGPIRSIFRTGVFKAAGGYDERFDSSDVVMNLKVAMRYPVLVLPEGLTWWRSHARQVSVRMRENDIGQREKSVWLPELIRDPACPLNEVQKQTAEALADHEFRLFCRHYLARGRIVRAWKNWKSADQSLSRLFRSGSKPPASSLALDPDGGNAGIGPRVTSGKAAFSGAEVQPESAPLVSVIIGPAENARLTATSAESLRGQQCDNWELIVIQSKSDPAVSEKPGLDLGGRPVRFLDSDAFADKWEAYEKSAKLATGKYLKFLEPGDILYPYGLKIMASLMQYHQSALGISGPCAPYKPGTCLSPRDSWVSEFFLPQRFTEGMSALIVSKGVFENIGGFPTDNQPVEKALQLRLSAEGPTVLINPGLVGYGAAGLACAQNGARNPFGRGQGYEWLVPWLESGQSPLTGERVTNAVGNLLTAAWHQSRGKIPFHYRFTVLKLAAARRIPPGKFLGRRWRRYGWSPEDEARLQKLNAQAPAWESFNPDVESPLTAG